MPKRSNPFQRLIYIIQNELAAEGEVRESDFLPSKSTGSLVEVDVTIRTNIAGVNLLLCLECTARGRAATVEWVHQMMGKHKDLPTDKLVLVSKSGFTDNATKVAAVEGIDTFSLREAETFEWSKIVPKLVDNPNLKIAHFSTQIDTWSLTLQGEVGHEVTGLETDSFNENSLVYDPSGDVQGTIKQLGVTLLHQPTVREGVMRKWIQSKDSIFTLTWHCPEGTSVEDKYGHRFILSEVVFEGSSDIEEKPVLFSAATYGEAQVVHTTIPDFFTGSQSDVKIVFTEEAGKGVAGSLVFSSDSGFGEEIFPMNRPSPTDDDVA